MASELANGNYMIVSAMSSNLHLDVAGAGTADGTNVQLYYRNYSRAQSWKVTKTSKGYEILSRWLGKALDAEASSGVHSGSNVMIYRDHDGTNQRWTLVDTGETMKVDGTAYPLYYVYNYGTSLVMDGEGATATAGTNVFMCTLNKGSNQKWAFVPIPKICSGGVYELRSLMAPTKLTLDVNGLYKANGTNVMICDINHGNNQKFYFTNEGDGWSLRDINSGKYVDVTGGAVTVSGTNVQLYEDNDTRAQRWAVTEFGTKKINGTECAVVRLGAGNKNTCVMDSYGNVARSGSNVMICTPNEGDNQKWVLWPTSAVDSNMPTPYNIKLASAVGGNSYVNITPYDTLYPAWECSDAWVTDGPCSYRWRWRKRVMKGTTSSWQAWGAWSAWETPSFRQVGKKVWETHGINVNYQFSDNVKNEQIELQVCSQGITDNKTDNITSSIKDQVCNVIRRPTLEITDVAWSCDGLRCAYETDYPYGSIIVHLKTLKFAGKDALKAAVDVTARSGSFLIPQSSIKFKPADGAAAAMTFALGNDQLTTFGGTLSGSGTVAYDAGTVDVTPTVYEADGLTLECTVPYANTVRMWMVTDGEDVVLEGTVANGKTTFSYIYPYGKILGIFTSYANSDGSEWGTDYTELTTRANPGIHAFNWPGGFFFMWLNENEVSEKRAYSTESEEHVLAGRSHPVVSFLHDSEGNAFTAASGTAEGVLVPNDKYGCTLDDLESLLEAAHVTYRAPSGRYAAVAVTGADVERNSRFATVSISMVEEQL